MPDYQRYECETKCPLFDSPVSVAASTARTPIIIHKQNSPEPHITLMQAIQIGLWHQHSSLFFLEQLGTTFHCPWHCCPFPSKYMWRNKTQQMKPTPVATHMLSSHSCSTHVPTSRKGLSQEWLWLWGWLLLDCYLCWCLIRCSGDTTTSRQTLLVYW